MFVLFFGFLAQISQTLPHYFCADVKNVFIHLKKELSVSVVSLVQNLTFEDIHAVRTYEKAWVLRMTASHTDQEVLIL